MYIYLNRKTVKIAYLHQKMVYRNLLVQNLYLLEVILDLLCPGILFLNDSVKVKLCCIYWLKLFKLGC